MRKLILSIMVITCLHPLQAGNNLLSYNLIWDIATLTIASDYDPLLRNPQQPDRGAQAVMQMMRKSIGKQVQTQPITYLSTLPSGDTITLSGCLYLPIEGDIKQLIIANHYTICSNQEVPSQTLAFEAIFCTKGYAVLMADYIGYGVSQKHIHPYLHKSSSARSVVDLLLYFNSHQTDLLHGRKILNDSLLIVGYSQGAAVTLATTNLLQTQYSNQIKISKVFAGDGPYNPALMYDEWVGHDLSPLPCAIPLSVLGMDVGDSLHLDLTHLFKEPLLSHYRDWILSKQYSINQIAQMMGSLRVSDAMPPEGMNKQETDAAYFYRALEEQDLTTFIPQVPLYLFHSTNDNWVPFVCSQQLAENISNHPTAYTLLTTDFNTYGNHPIAIVRFFHNVFNMLP